MTRLEHVYTPRGGCKELMECRDDEVLISGPAGTGKSRACLEKMLTVCLMNRGTRGLILRKTLRSLGSTALTTWRRYVAKEAIATGNVVYYGGSSQEPPQYRFKNGSTITIGGLDNPVRIMSSEYDIIFVQEATEITLNDLELINTRLRNWNISFQQLIMDCNPNSSRHWLKLRVDEGTTTLIRSRHEDNPRLYDDNGVLTKQGQKYIKILDNLTGVRYKRLRKGLWGSAEGVVYENYDEEVHRKCWEFDSAGKRVELPETWPRYWVIDFGFVHPFVLQCWAVSPADVLYMYREIYMTNKTVGEHAQTIMDIVRPTTTTEYYDHLNKRMVTQEITEWVEPRPNAVICDHDAESRRNFERATGLSTVPAVKRVNEGIDLVMRRLDNGEIRIMEDALVERDQRLADRAKPLCLNDEWGMYEWKTSNENTQEEPRKLYDDGLDCVRYMVAHLDTRNIPRASLIER